MQKTLLAAALMAGLATAGVAQAESSVTLYGIADAGYGYSQYKLNDHNVDLKKTSSGLLGGSLAGNRFGLRGSEDLGNGLRAIFTLEQGFDIGSGAPADSDRQFSRQAFVGVASDSWGTFTMGRQYDAGVDAGIVENGDGTNGFNLGDMDKAFGSTGMNGGTRIDNSFKYTTPSMAGFKAIFLYGTGGNGNTTVFRNGNDDTKDTNRGNHGSVGLVYANGPLSVGASYTRENRGETTTGDFNTTQFTKDAVTNWNIGAAYDFEVVKLSLAYGRDLYGKLGMGAYTSDYLGQDLDIENYSDFKSNNYHVGLSAPLAGGVLYAGWNRSTSNLDADKADGGWGDLAGNINTYHINYQYPLSKRTTVYVYGSYAQNLGYVDGLKGKEAGLGMLHAF